MVEDREIVSVEEAAVEPYATILCYPRPDITSVTSRVDQLRELGVSALEFTGGLKLGKLSLLGKGVAGTVVVGRTGRKRVALKIRRIDSRRDSVMHETQMLRIANSIQVGPRYYGSTTDVILMELVEGHSLPEWLTTLVGKGRRSRARETIESLFEQCVRLDSAGLDHGELSRAHKNVCVTEGGRPVILDFESASIDRQPKNLTSIAQYFFMGSGFARRVRRVIGPTDTARLRETLGAYKSERSPDAFHRLQELLRL